ncbi:MAG: hypothetical protein ACREEE_14565 [Dongiaceae bacterium]
MSTDRLEPFLNYHPFTRLNALLHGIPAGGAGPTNLLSVGEPRMRPPDMVTEMLARHAEGWGRHPLATGTAEFRGTVSDWLARRLWTQAGIRVLPGTYMARPDSVGEDPGHRYIRVALVHDIETMTTALRRLVQTLADDISEQTSQSWRASALA